VTEAGAAPRSIGRAAFAAPASTLHHAAVWSLRALLAVVIFAWFAVAPPRSAQLALSLELGRRAIVEHRFEIGWFGELVTYLANAAAGFGGLAAIGGVLVVATLALIEFRARPRTGDVLSLAAMILAAFCFLDALRPGGGAAHWICAAAFLLVLERARGWSIFITVAIAAIWANVAPDAILAPFIAGLVAIGRVADRRLPPAALVRMSLVVLGCAAALLLTPEGLDYLWKAPFAAHLDRGLSAVIPFAPKLVAPRAYATLFAILVMGAALGSRHCRWEDRFLFAGAIGLAFWNGEYLPLAGIVAAPIVVGTVVRFAPQFFAPPSSRGRLANGLVAAIAIVLALGFAGSTPARVARAAVQREPAEAVISRVAAAGREHRLFCLVVDWCNYAAGFGNVRVLMDGRVERADPAALEAQQAIARVKPAWKNELAQRGIDAVVAHRADAVAQLLAFAPGWEATDLQDGVILFERVSGGGAR
jgi:hypothetical protein